MKVGRSFDKTDLFSKASDNSDDITEGTVKLFYPDGDKTKVGYLPGGATAYLEIEKVATNPGTGQEGEVIYNTTDTKFYLWETTAWVEVLFSLEKILP